MPKRILWPIIICILLIAAYFLYVRPVPREKDLSYSDFWQKLNQNQVVEVTVDGQSQIIHSQLVDKTKFKTNYLYDPDLVRVLREKGVKIWVKLPTAFNPSFIFLIIVVAMGVLYMTMRWQSKMMFGQHQNFTKNSAKLANQGERKYSFADVAGLDEIKDEVQEVIDFLKKPDKFSALGANAPRGVLLVGPAGCGKTLLAKAIAGEASVPFLSVSGSEFVEVFVGVGAGRVRDLFNKARKMSPCIIFIDELDAVGRHRGAGIGGGHDEREQTLNQILVEMDGFDTTPGLVLIAATNRPDILDPALLRPGRFDRKVILPKPDVRAREAILKVHTRNKPLAEDVNLDELAKLTPGFSGADLKNIVNEAAILAARENANKIYRRHFDQARDKVMMGMERKIVMDDDEKKIVAIHEVGHVLVTKFTPNVDPVQKVSIIPRGFALGLTQTLPLKERYNPTKSYLMAQLSILLGGRIAEEIVLGTEDITTGAANDLKRATQLVEEMVCKLGMGSIQVRTFGESQEEVFLGLKSETSRNYSEETAKQIDADIIKILDLARKNALQILSDHKADLDKLVKALLEKETLEADEITKIIAN